MFSHYDLVDELTNLADAHGFIHSESIGQLKDKYVCVSGAWFTKNLILRSQIGILSTGISQSLLLSAVQSLKKDFMDAGIKFKVVFSGSEIFTDKSYFQNQTIIRTKLYELIWELELTSSKGDHQATKISEAEAERAKSELLKSSFYNSVVETEVRDLVKDLMFEEEIEFIIAPGQSANQLVWMYNYDYCQAVVGDLNLFPFSDSLPLIILDFDFRCRSFEYIHQREYAEALKLIKLKEKRQIELWSFSVPPEQLSYKDISILTWLEDCHDGLDRRIDNIQVERSNKVKFCIERIGNILSRLELPATSAEKQFSDGINSVVPDKFTKRESILYRIDCSQAINSSIEFPMYPNTRNFSMSEQEKGKLKALYMIDFPMSKKFYAYYSFGVINHQFLLMTAKPSKYQLYLLPPAADSAEHQDLVQEYMHKELEGAVSVFLSNYGKLWFTNEYGMESYHLVSNSLPAGSESPGKLSGSMSSLPFTRVKETFEALESGERLLYFFRESAFKTQEGKKTDLEGLPPKRLGVSFKGTTSMAFLCFNTSTDSSELNLTPFTLKKPDSSPNKTPNAVAPVHAADAVFSKKEILGFVAVNLLQSLHLVNVKEKKLSVVGAALMRQGVVELEEPLLLLFELTKVGHMQGKPLTPADKKHPKPKKTDQDLYLSSALRKSSEELRAKPTMSVNGGADDFPSLTQGGPKHSKSLESDQGAKPTPELDIVMSILADLRTKCASSSKKSGSGEVPAILQTGLNANLLAKVLVASRVYMLLDFTMALGDLNDQNQKKDLLKVDFDASRYLHLVSSVQQTLRYKAESLFSLALATGGKLLTLKEIEELKVALPFRRSLSNKLATLVKQSLIEFIVLQEARQSSSPNQELIKYLETRSTLKQLSGWYPSFSNLAEDLQAGQNLLTTAVKMMNYVTERGLDTKTSQVPQLWRESLELLSSWLGTLGVALQHGA